MAFSWEYNEGEALLAITMMCTFSLHMEALGSEGRAMPMAGRYTPDSLTQRIPKKPRVKCSR